MLVLTLYIMIYIKAKTQYLVLLTLKIRVTAEHQLFIKKTKSQLDLVFFLQLSELNLNDYLGGEQQNLIGLLEEQ